MIAAIDSTRLVECAILAHQMKPILQSKEPKRSMSFYKKRTVQRRPEFKEKLNEFSFLTADFVLNFILIVVFAWQRCFLTLLTAIIHTNHLLK